MTELPDPAVARPVPDHESSLRLRILQTTDIHGHILPFDYYGDRAEPAGGLARVATLVARARAEAGPGNCLLLDNGDFLQGTPLTDLTPQPGQGWRGRHPVLRAMNLMAYDAATLGNHEFNFGLDWLRKTLTEARFPLTCANVVLQAGATPDQDRTLLPPYLILTRRMRDSAGGWHELRIGLLGLVPPQIMIWDHTHLAGRLTARDMVESARAWLPMLRAAGADLVIMMAHSGIDPGPARPMMENATRALADLPGIDVLLAGHSHRRFPDPMHQTTPGADVARGTLMGIPCVKAGYAGSHLGQIDLTLSRGTGKWQIAGHETRLLATNDVPPDRRIMRALAAAHAHTRRLSDRILGESTAPLHSYLALLRNDPGTQLVNDAQRAALAEALAGTAHAALPFLSASAPFKTGGRGGPAHYTDIPAGPLRLRNIADLYGYPNTLCGLLITGAELRDWLERAVICFRQITPGAPNQTLLDPNVPGHDFDVIDGLTYSIDLTQPPRYGRTGEILHPAARRIRSLCHAGRPLDDNARFVIATNSYRAWGGGPFPALAETALLYARSRPIRDLVAAHVRQRGTITPAARPTWRFAPMPRTLVEIETGPGLRNHPTEIEALGATDLGKQATGFASLRLTLPLARDAQIPVARPDLANPGDEPYVRR